MTFSAAVDARCLNTDFVRGMGEDPSPLATAMSALRDIKWVFLSNRPDQPFQTPETLRSWQLVLKDIRGSRFNAWEQIAEPFQAMRAKVQVLHCVGTTLPLWQPVPTIVTIHDTIPWETGEFLAPGFYRDHLLPAAYRRCKKIITISEHSRRDILKLWPDLEHKVRLIRHGVHDRFLRPATEPLTPALRTAGITTPYLVYFGGTVARKRLDWALELFEMLEPACVSLVVCGVARGAHDGLRQRLRPETRARVVFAPYLAPESMPSLYQNALAVLYPTVYEGFGFPPLNAQASGTPVLFSDVSSLRELVGPTSVPLDPEDRPAWLAACRAVVARRLANATPDSASRDWARRFDWRASAEAYWEVYHEAAGIPTPGG